MGEATEIRGRSALGGLLIGALVAVLTGTLTAAPWWLAAAAGGFAAVLGGGVLVLLFHAQRRVARELTGRTVTVRQLRQASRASESGPVPGDPEIHRLAVGFAERQLRSARRQRPWLVAMLVVLTALELFVALSGQWWAVVSTLGFGVFTVFVCVRPRLLARRLTRLRDTPPDDPRATGSRA
jgi:hypothetical protein